MALSRDLTELHVWFDTLLQGGAEFTLEGARAFLKSLETAAVEAAALEETTQAALEDLHGGVVRKVPRPGSYVVGGNVVPFRLRTPMSVPFSDGRAS